MMILDMGVSLGVSAGKSSQQAQVSEVDRQIAETEAKLDSADTSKSSATKQTSGSKGKPEPVQSGADGGEKAKLEERLAGLQALSQGLREGIKADDAAKSSNENKDKVAGKAETGKSENSQGQNTQNNTENKSDGSVKSDNSVAKSDSTASSSPTPEAPKKLEQAT